MKVAKINSAGAEVYAFAQRGARDKNRACAAIVKVAKNNDAGANIKTFVLRCAKVYTFAHAPLILQYLHNSNEEVDHNVIKCYTDTSFLAGVCSYTFKLSNDCLQRENLMRCNKGFSKISGVMIF